MKSSLKAYWMLYRYSTDAEPLATIGHEKDVPLSADLARVKLLAEALETELSERWKMKESDRLPTSPSMTLNSESTLLPQ